MPFGTFVETYFGAGAAVDFIIFENHKGSLIGVHPKFWRCIAPDGVNLLFKRSSYVHQAGVVSEDCNTLAN